MFIATRIASQAELQASRLLDQGIGLLPRHPLSD
jgi:hypothetical protein